MTIAEVHGKLANVENKEDLLTSDVFSAFRYLPVNLGLIPFLKQMVNGTTGKRIGNLFSDCLTADYVFWPKTSFFKREPDLLILIGRKVKTPIAVLIEAKYHSGKHDAFRKKSKETLKIYDGDQLAEQYAELNKRNIYLDGVGRELLLAADPLIQLFVTAHEAIPLEMIGESRGKLAQEGAFTGQNMYWINWQAAYDAATDTLTTQILSDYQRFVLEDLKKLLEWKGLVSFHGFHPAIDLAFPERYFWREKE